jgi:hypothetical protein
MRVFYRVVDSILINKVSIVGLGFCYYIGRRFTRNIQELE